MEETFHIREDAVESIYRNYLKGLTIEEITWKVNTLYSSGMDWDTVNEVIDCMNRLEM